MNMGQIIAIAQGIRNITQQELDDESSGEDSDEDENGKSSMSMAESNRKAELFEWVRFCKEKIEPIDKIWTKRLEDKGDSSSDEDMDPNVTNVRPSAPEDSPESEMQIAQILGKVPERRSSTGKKPAKIVNTPLINADKENGESENFDLENKEFSSYNFW